MSLMGSWGGERNRRQRREVDGTMDAAHVTKAELGLLEVLWDRGRSTTRELSERLYGEAVPSKLATVQKLLHRLERKGLVDRDRRAFVHWFEATISRDEFVGRQIEELAETFSGGSMASLLTSLVETKRLSRAERNKLRKLLDEMP